MQLYFFSDEYSKNFLPLTLTRPVFELRIGILTIREKWEKALNINFSAGIFAKHLHPLFNGREIDVEKDCIWINSRFLPNKNIIERINNLPSNSGLIQNGNVVAARLKADKSSFFLENNSFYKEDLSFKELDCSVQSISYFWDLLALNGEEIASDIFYLETPSLSGSNIDYPNLIVTNSEQIFISEEALIEAGCILIADKGPIYIGDNAIIEAGSIIRGPVAICEGATVKMRARIYNSSTIGPVCKVGGEISNSIFHSYSNKAHDGFTGSSLIGQWCNFGADTNTSNLKNNYAEAKIFDWTSKVEYEKGFQFFGTILGDHSKTAINTVLNTGTVCGVSTNIFSLGFPPRYIPSFQWMGQDKTVPYEFDKAIIAMKAMMARRKIDLSDDYLKMMETINSFN
ncbi:MAG: GlmU family protein [Balneolaceae bacterium]